MVYATTQRGFIALLAIGLTLLIAFFSWTTLMVSNKRLRESVKRNSNMSPTRYIEEYRPSPESTSSYEATRNTTHLPSLHHLYPVNCSAVFAGDKREILRVDHMLNYEKKKSPLVELNVPSDELVGDYTSDCEVYRKVREYPTKVLSEEEMNFPLAFIILTHKNAAQVELLLRAIYQPHNVYAIHPDKKSPPIFHRAIENLARCFDNVFICSKLESIQYAGYTRLSGRHKLHERSRETPHSVEICHQPMRGSFPIENQP